MDPLKEVLAALKAIREKWEGKAMPEDVRADFAQKLDEAKALKEQAEQMKELRLDKTLNRLRLD